MSSGFGLLSSLDQRNWLQISSSITDVLGVMQMFLKELLQKLSSTHLSVYKEAEAAEREMTHEMYRLEVCLCVKVQANTGRFYFFDK